MRLLCSDIITNSHLVMKYTMARFPSLECKDVPRKESKKEKKKEKQKKRGMRYKKSYKGEQKVMDHSYGVTNWIFQKGTSC